MSDSDFQNDEERKKCRDFLDQVFAFDRAFANLDEAAKSVSEYSDGTTEFGRDAEALAGAFRRLDGLGFGSLEEAFGRTAERRCE